MSDGATVYLVAVSESGFARARRSWQSGFRSCPTNLANEFFRGLSVPDAKECYRCVGKVHIVDMLNAVLASWPDAPARGRGRRR